MGQQREKRTFTVANERRQRIRFNRRSSAFIVTTTILGIIAGLCTWWWMGRVPASEAWTLVLSRTILGFALGLSVWKANWAVHGIILRIVFSLPGAADAVWNHWGAAGFWGWIVSGLIAGLLIE